MSEAPREAGTVPIRVQVIDLEPRLVDIVVPTYLKCEDLTQRIARDVGLGGWWDDGTRRTFHLRARGRVLRGEEKLEDVGVVPYELLHLLPLPREGEPIRERASGVPAELSRPVGRMARILRWTAMLGWSVAWAVAVSGSQDRGVAWWPAFGQAWLVAYALRQHGTPVWAARTLVPVASLSVILWIPALFTAVVSAPTLWVSTRFVAASALGLAVGNLVAALAWMGPLEAVVGRDAEVADADQAQAAVVACGICALSVEVAVSEPCRYNCGRTFHRGCLRARQSVATGAGCEVCGADVGHG